MAERPLAFVMEQTLGNITHYLNLKRAEAAVREARVRWLPIEYADGRLPWTVRGSLLARRAAAPLMSEVDGMFVHTMTLAPAMVDLMLRVPTVISTDGPALAKLEMRSAYGNEPEPALASRAKGAVYRALFSRAAGFVAWSHWAKRSLVRDYGCRDDDVAVISPGVDLDFFVPGPREHRLPRILFVGGDFVRKGGDLLLEVFRERLRGRAELVLVTRDDVAVEPGVTVRRNVAANSPELRDLYAGCDIFALPTRADCYSLVCMEALSAGMPVVTTRVGGIPDLVREGETGFAVDMDDAEALGRHLSELVLDHERRRSMGRAARLDAEARFGTEQTARQLFSFVRSRCR